MCSLNVPLNMCHRGLAFIGSIHSREGRGGESINPGILCDICVTRVSSVVIRVYVTLICIQDVGRKEVRSCPASHALPCVLLISVSEERSFIKPSQGQNVSLFYVFGCECGSGNVPRSRPNWTPSKGFIKRTDFPLTARMNCLQIAACLKKMAAWSV